MRPTTLITAAGLVLAIACNPISPEVSDGQNLVHQEFTAAFESATGTRTSLSGTDVLWDESGEALDIVCQEGSFYTVAQTSVSQDRNTASFSGDVPQTGKLFAVYPEGLCSAYADGALSVDIPSIQMAVADGFTSHTAPMVAKVTDGETMHMRNICGLLGFKVSNSNIKSISFSATESGGGAMTGYGLVSYSGADPVCTTNASTGSDEVIMEGDIQPGEQYWALIYPGTYTNLKVVFTDIDDRTATFTKDGTLVINRSKARRISTFTINESDWDDYVPAGDGSFNLVTDASTLNAGDEVLIVYTAGSKALGAINGSGNYRDPVDISISGNTIASEGNATVLTVEAGTASGTWAFKDGDNYLASASSGNYLKNSASKTENASWAVSIASKTGLATIQAQAGASIYLSYNLSSPRFACYKNTDQKAVSIYRRSGSGSVPGVPTVTTKAATGVGMAEAKLNASFSGIPTSPDPTAAFFRWGTSVSALTGELYDNETLLNTSSGSFSALLTGLQEGTTYYYQAVMTLANGSDVEGEVMSFSTLSAQQSNAPGYLACYEIPAVDVSGSVTSGSEKYGYKWYKYYTTNSKRAVATHTAQYNGKVIRNYTVMMDADKKSPVWCATAFNTGTWPDKNVGRTGSWTSDPAFPASWQQENGTGPYGKGHCIASNYRQTTSEMNKQTFYLSNQAAQYQTRFNDGIWNTLEQKVAATAPSGRDTLYVVVGVLFEGNTTVTSGIYIPSHFYKCLMKCSFNANGVMTAATGCAYLFENKEYSGSNYNSYKTTIDAVEERAGFDFFHNVPDELEAAAESTAGSPI